LTIQRSGANLVSPLSRRSNRCARATRPCAAEHRRSHLRPLNAFGFLLTFVLVTASVAGAAESCTLGATFAVLPGGEVERAGDLADLMTKSGTITLDVERMTVTYDFRRTIRNDGTDTVTSFRGSAPLHRQVTKPDDHWICDQPKCASKIVLDSVLKQL